MKKLFEDYCVGCGLCEAAGKAICYQDGKGFLHPQSGDESWLAQVCPSGGRQQDWMDFSNVWGRSNTVIYGWSADPSVRQIASSGGVLTEVASWLLENHKVDGIVHTCADPDDPTKTISCVSTQRGELISRSGSRYAISHPLVILASLDRTKRYAFIGKPCDITALNNFMEVAPEWKGIIIYTLSFFCAGLPSKDAQEKLLAHLDCPKEELKYLRYRGDGWPGFTTAVESSGKEHKTEYETSWGKILGRDIMKMCRFCLDGVGEAADISCGDAWYLTPDKKPDFSEAEGRNVIFARSDLGKEILDAVIADKKICVEVAHIDDLRHMQPYQLDRRATMADKLFIMRVLFKCVPHYRSKNILQYYSGVKFRRHLSILKGTVLRALEGKV